MMGNGRKVSERAIAKSFLLEEIHTSERSPSTDAGNGVQQLSPYFPYGPGCYAIRKNEAESAVATRKLLVPMMPERALCTRNVHSPFSIVF